MTITGTNDLQTFEHDDFGRQIFYRTFEDKSSRCEYDLFGRLAAKKFFNNADGTGTAADTWTYKYDVFGHLLQNCLPNMEQ